MPEGNQRFVFRVQGSALDPYEVLITRSGSNITARCTCPAGWNASQCKHRIRILNGDVQGIVTGNESDVAIVSSWLAGSDIEIALKELKQAEIAYDKAKAALSASKKKLAQSLAD